MTLRAVFAAAGALAVLSGCAVGVSGEPLPGKHFATPSTSASSGPKYPDLLPPRSHELDLSGVDPCTGLLTTQQLRQLDYDLGYARPPLPDHSDIHGGPDCTFASNGGAGGASRNMRSLVGISTTEGALAWVTDPAREPDRRPRVVDIQGFSALVLPHPKIPDDCLVVVDTAEDQYLEVASSSSTGDGADADPYCAEATHVAGMAIQTVLTTAR